jgi:anthraniloyl-CoA monooxygenase
MDAILADYRTAAEFAVEADFDMIELHMAHGYLLASFISPLTNRRTDAYGGNLEARMKFPLEVIDAVREVWPDDRPMSVRVSASDWQPDGLTPQDSVAIAHMLKGHGVDLVDVSAGQTSPDAKPVYGRMFQTPFADRIRNEANIATMAVGNIFEPDHVNSILAAGRADLVALARPHLTDPNFTIRAAAWYGVEGVAFPPQYFMGRDALYRNLRRDREELEDMKRKVRPKARADMAAHARG